MSNSWCSEGLCCLRLQGKFTLEDGDTLFWNIANRSSSDSVKSQTTQMLIKTTEYLDSGTFCFHVSELCGAELSLNIYIT